MSDAVMRERLDALEATVKRQGAQLRYLRRLVDGAPALKPSRDELANYMRDIRAREERREGHNGTADVG